MIGLADPHDVVNTIKAFALSDGFDKLARAAAGQMVTHLFTDAGRTWRQAAKHNSKGRQVYEALRKELNGPMGATLQHLTEQNAAIIKSLPLDIARQVTAHVAKESLKGTRASDIADQIITMFPQTSRAKADLIARTETSKTQTALTEARCQSLGVGWYIWRTSKDQRVRDSHKLMSDVLVRWSDPPSPEELDGESRTYGHYHAGNVFNCRCYTAPLIDLDLVTWPARVYYNGSIQRMTRKQFERIAA